MERNVSEPVFFNFEEVKNLSFDVMGKYYLQHSFIEINNKPYKNEIRTSRS